jgi:hypothetical protein
MEQNTTFQPTQGYNVSRMDYVEDFKALVDVVKTYGDAYGNKLGLIIAQLIAQGAPDFIDLVQIAKAEATCCKHFLLCMVLRGSGSTCDHQLKTDLANDMTKGLDHFPKTIIKTMHLLNNYKVPAKHQYHCKPGGDGFMFVQGNKPAKAEALPKSDIKCWHCSKKGHYNENKCPELQVLDVGMQNMHIDNWQLNMDLECNKAHSLVSSADGWMMVQNNKKGVHGLHGILSLFHVYMNMCASYVSTPYPQLLQHLMTQAQGLIGYSNAGLCGIMSSSRKLGAIGQMWLNKGGIATIVPLKQIEQIRPVSYDSRIGKSLFLIHLSDGNIVMMNNNKGMPYLDLKDPDTTISLGINNTHDIIQGMDDMAVLFVQMVRSNMEGFMDVRSRMPALLARHRPCSAIQPIASSWGWYITT